MTKKEYNCCVDDYAGGLYRFLLKSLQNSEKAKDLVQDTFEKLWLRREEVSSSKAKSFLFTIAYHAMIDLLRREKRIERLEQADTHQWTHSNQYSDLNEALHKAIERLPADQRAVVLLRDYEGYSYAEIGQLTGFSEAKVKVTIFRARDFLREYIGAIEILA